MIEYWQYSNSGPSIIFLPGGNIDYRCYEPLVAKISKSNKVISLNLPGLGKSSSTRSINETVDVLNNFINSLNEENITIVGHSFGGTLADILAQTNKSITKEVLMDSTVFTSPKNIFDIVFRLIHRVVVGSIKYPNLIKYNLESIFYLLERLILNFQGASSHIQQITDNVFRPTPLAMPSKVERLILWGDKDELIPVKEIPKRFFDHIVFIDGNHDWCVAYPDLATEKIVQFVNT